MRKSKVSNICSLLLALLHTTTSSTAPNTTALTYLARPADVTVAVGRPAVFICGVPEASPELTFTLYGSPYNHTLTCPFGHFEDIPQALYGSCEMKKGESLAVWTIKRTSLSDNGTRVVCQQSENPDAAAAALHVHDNVVTQATLIGCVIGGFFGTLLVAAVLYCMLQGSATLQDIFREKETEDDEFTIVED